MVGVPGTEGTAGGSVVTNTTLEKPEEPSLLIACTLLIYCVLASKPVHTTYVFEVVLYSRRLSPLSASLAL